MFRIYEYIVHNYGVNIKLVNMSYVLSRFLLEVDDIVVKVIVIISITKMYDHEGDCAKDITHRIGD